MINSHRRVHATHLRAAVACVHAVPEGAATHLQQYYASVQYIWAVVPCIPAIYGTMLYITVGSLPAHCSVTRLTTWRGLHSLPGLPLVASDPPAAQVHSTGRKATYSYSYLYPFLLLIDSCGIKCL